MSMMDIKGARESLRVKRAFIREEIADCAEMIGDRASAREIDRAGDRRHANSMQGSATFMAKRLNELFANIGADEILKEQQQENESKLELLSHEQLKENESIALSPESFILTREDDEDHPYRS